MQYPAKDMQVIFSENRGNVENTEIVESQRKVKKIGQV